MSLVPAMLRARSVGLPVVLWGHGYAKGQTNRRRGARRWLARFADALTFYEPATRDAYVSDGWPAHKLFIAINSLDHHGIVAARDDWLASPERLARFRREHALDTGPTVLFVSRLVPANRVDLLIEATGKLALEVPGLKTVIIGNGAAEKRRLQALARTVGAADNVVFVDGVYDEMKLAPWFLSADLFCYPANIGLSLIHAYWYGLPVVTSDNLASQNPEIIALNHGVNGLLYERENSASLARALHTVLTDPTKRSSMAQEARRTVEGRFTIARMVDGLEAAIRYAYSTRLRSDGEAVS